MKNVLLMTVESIEQSLGIIGTSNNIKEITSHYGLYCVLNIIETAKLLMICEKRTKMSCKHVNDSLMSNKSGICYGYSSFETQKSVLIKFNENEEGLAFIDSTMDIDSIICRDMPPYDLQVVCDITPLVMNGEILYESQVLSHESTMETSKKNSKRHEKSYISHIVSCLKEGGRMMVSTLNQISTESYGMNTFELLIEYISESISKDQNDISVINENTLLMHALLSNKAFSIYNQMEKIVSIALTLLLSPYYSNSDEIYHKSVRIRSAELLSFIVSKFKQFYPTIPFQVAEDLIENGFLANNRYIWAGVFRCFDLLGDNVIKTVLFPYLQRIHESVKNHCPQAMNDFHSLIGSSIFKDQLFYYYNKRPSLNSITLNTLSEVSNIMGEKIGQYLISDESFLAL